MKIFTIKITPNLAIETGIHVGDGSMNIYNNQYCYTVACHKEDDKEFMEEVVLPLIRNLYGKNPKLRNWSQGSYGFRIVSKDIILFKNKVLELPLGKKSRVMIPIRMYGNNKLFIHFIKGFFATDGCFNLWFTNRKDYPRLYMSNISKNLILQIKNGMERNGFKVSYWKAKGHKNWNTEHRISINGNTMLDRWNSTIGFINPKHKLKYKNFKKSI